MYHRIVISSFAAVAIGMSCIATDASARGGGGGRGFGGGFGEGGGGRSGGTAPGVRSNITGPTAGGGYFVASGVRAVPSITGVRGAVGGGGRFAAPGVRVMPRIIGVGGPTGGGSIPGGNWKTESATGVLGPTGGGAADAAGGGVAAGARYYAPASYDSNAACGRYPYPPCNRVPAR
jgi:hypothetical protein